MTPEGTFDATSFSSVSLDPSPTVGQYSLRVGNGGIGFIYIMNSQPHEVANQALRRVSKWLTEGESGNLHWTKAGFRLRKAKG